MIFGCVKLDNGLDCDCPYIIECGSVYQPQWPGNCMNCGGLLPHPTDTSCPHCRADDYQGGAVIDQYDLVRKTHHATLGDSVARWKRDEDAFTAGAQYALDCMLTRVDDLVTLIDPPAAEYLVGLAADILTRVHEGTL